MTFKNYTPHTINETTTGVSFPSEGIARISTNSQHVGEANGIPFFTVTLGHVEGLPTPERDTFIIVSGMVFDASDRDDLVAPGDLIRNDEGNPIGCKGFRAKVSPTLEM